MIITTEIDYNEAERVHSKFYANEFSLPDFGSNHFVSRFQITSDKSIITTGGFRLIPEIILITDKDAPVLDRKLALYTSLDYMINIAKQQEFDCLHAFVQNEQWKQRLIRTGFKHSKGECLVLGV